MAGSTHFLKLALFLLLVGHQTSASASELYGSGWYGELQTSLGLEDNISRSYNGSDEESDEFLRFSIGGGHSQKISDSGQLVFSGYLTVNKHNNFDDLDHLATSIGASYTHQFHPGYDTAWYVADIRATLMRYRDSEAREGLLINGDLSVNRRFGARSVWHLGYRYSEMVFTGKSSAEEDRDIAFDTDGDEIYLGVDYQMTTKVFTYGEYAFRKGKVWSNFSAMPTAAGYDQFTMDNAFNPCTTGCGVRYAGRIESDVHRVNMGIAFPIRSTNVDLSAVYYEAQGDNGRNYRGHFFSAGLIWYF